MTKEEFIAEYEKFADKALALAEKARRESVLSLEENLDWDKVKEREFFNYGLRFVIDGTDTSIIDKILTNIIEQENDEYAKKLKTIQKEAVIGIQLGYNTRILHQLMNSYTDLIENFYNEEGQ